MIIAGGDANYYNLPPPPPPISNQAIYCNLPPGGKNATYANDPGKISVILRLERLFLLLLLGIISQNTWYGIQH